MARYSKNMTEVLKKAQSTTEVSGTHELSHKITDEESNLITNREKTFDKNINWGEHWQKQGYIGSGPTITENVDASIGDTTSTQLTNAETEILEEESTNLSVDDSGDISFNIETSEGGIPSILGSEGHVPLSVQKAGGTVEEKYSPNMAATLKNLKKGGQK